MTKLYGISCCYCYSVDGPLFVSSSSSVITGGCRCCCRKWINVDELGLIGVYDNGCRIKSNQLW